MISDIRNASFYNEYRRIGYLNGSHRWRLINIISKYLTMSKKRKTHDPAEIPGPDKDPEIRPDSTPHEPKLPGEEPEIFPETQPEIEPETEPQKPTRPDIE